jgi:hypothetical protein
VQAVFGVKKKTVVAMDRRGAGGHGRCSDHDVAGQGRGGGHGVDPGLFHGGGSGEFQGSNLVFDPGYGGDDRDRGWQRGGFRPRGSRGLAPRRGGFAGQRWHGARAGHHGHQSKDPTTAGRGYRPIQTVQAAARPLPAPTPGMDDAAAAAAVTELAFVVGSNAAAGAWNQETVAGDREVHRTGKRRRTVAAAV